MRWSLVAAVNDDHVLQTSLLRSPDVTDSTDVVLKRGFSAAAVAYNEALDECRGDIVVFVHQDVYLPPGWIEELERQIERVEQVDANWAVLGVCGVNLSGDLVGHIYSTGLRGIYGQSFETPVPASSVDEVVIVLRRASGLRFDESLPGFHLYGTDICLQAIRGGMPCFIISALCVHNSNGISKLPQAFWPAYWALRRKWKAYLPVVTTCTTIYPGLARAWYEVFKGYRGSWFRPATPGRRVEDPTSLLPRLHGAP